MPQPAKGARLGGGPAHERLMLSNLATALFEHGRITTTAARAKRLRPVAERMITFAKRGDLHARRRVLRVIRDKSVVHTLFTEIGPKMAERPGGYTRITKIGMRKGDSAPMVVIELVNEAMSPKKAVVSDAEKATRRAAAAAPVAETPESAASADSAESAESAPSAESPAEADDANETDEVADEAAAAEAEAEADAVEEAEADAIEEAAEAPAEDEAEAPADEPDEEDKA